MVTGECGVGHAVLVEQLRGAVDELAMQYEDIACVSLGQSERERLGAALAGKRR